jgi:hypothetical protein
LSLRSGCRRSTVLRSSSMPGPCSCSTSTHRQAGGRAGRQAAVRGREGGTGGWRSGWHFKLDAWEGLRMSGSGTRQPQQGHPLPSGQTACLGCQRSQELSARQPTDRRCGQCDELHGAHQGLGDAAQGLRAGQQGQQAWHGRAGQLHQSRVAASTRGRHHASPEPPACRTLTAAPSAVHAPGRPAHCPAPTHPPTWDALIPKRGSRNRAIVSSIS